MEKPDQATRCRFHAFALRSDHAPWLVQHGDPHLRQAFYESLTPGETAGSLLLMPCLGHACLLAAVHLWLVRAPPLHCASPLRPPLGTALMRMTRSGHLH